MVDTDNDDERPGDEVINDEIEGGELGVDEEEDNGVSFDDVEKEADTTSDDPRGARIVVMKKAYKDGLREVPLNSTWKSIEHQMKILEVMHKVKFVKEGNSFGSFNRPDFTNEKCWETMLWDMMPGIRGLSDRKKCIKWCTYLRAMKKKFSDYKTNLAMKQKKAFLKCKLN